MRRIAVPAPWANKLPLVLAVASMAGLVVLLTPLPDLHFASCDRPCHELDWPMICRFKLTLEVQQSMGGWCGDCPRNMSDCFRPGCIVGDGTPRRVMAVNKQLPGPNIQVCENDILVVDVVNRIPGQSVAIHWRGQHQRESPYMDGVPMITQCPISSYTTFQYKFRASQPGTHLWHAHTGNELIDGLFGSLIVRRADKIEEQRHLYDVDDRNHVLILSDWGSSDPIAPYSRAESKILINGIAFNSEEIVPKLAVLHGVKYRIRMAHAGGGQGCPFYVSIQKHSLLVILIDGKPITPKETTILKFSQGERVDFVLKTDQTPGTYWLKVQSDCTDSVGFAKIEYKTNHEVVQPSPGEMVAENQITTNYKLLSTDICQSENPENVCLPQLESLKRIPEQLSEKVDVKLYLPFDFVKMGSKASGIGYFTPRFNNITFTFPPSPLLSQSYDLDAGMICNADRKPKRCNSDNSICECVHVIDIPLNSRVELLLIDQGNEDPFDHVFHLHGHSFYVVGSAENVSNKKLEEIKILDSKGLLMTRNLNNPIMKDTVQVPKGGAVALRFISSNPGYWLLHDQNTLQWTNGLDLVLKVGRDRDLPTAPDNFPHCGSWIGPDFFLI